MHLPIMFFVEKKSFGCNLSFSNAHFACKIAMPFLQDFSETKELSHDNESDFSKKNITVAQPRAFFGTRSMF